MIIRIYINKRDFSSNYESYIQLVTNLCSKYHLTIYSPTNKLVGEAAIVYIIRNIAEVLLHELAVYRKAKRLYISITDRDYFPGTFHSLRILIHFKSSQIKVEGIKEFVIIPHAMFIPDYRTL